MSTQNIKIEESWKAVLSDEFSKPYFQSIKDFLVQEKNDGKVIYPLGNLIFNAFNLTPFDSVKVVILGQDPYHNPGEAEGLCFSVPKEVKIPASLRNIYKELTNDVSGFQAPAHGCLQSWAEQGVLMLNAMLTVEKNQPASHQKIGWQLFTDTVIRKMSEQRTGVVFLLWGNFAKQKAALIDEKRHHILTAAHPSPLAGNAFQGCGHFSKTNELLTAQGQTGIDWGGL